MITHVESVYTLNGNGISYVTSTRPHKPQGVHTPIKQQMT